MEEIRTGRMKGRKMSGSEGRYTAIVRSMVEESLVGRFRLKSRVVYTLLGVFKLEISEAEWHGLL